MEKEKPKRPEEAGIPVEYITQGIVEDLTGWPPDDLGGLATLVTKITLQLCAAIAASFLVSLGTHTSRYGGSGSAVQYRI